MLSISLYGSGSRTGESHENAMALPQFYQFIMSFKFPGESKGPEHAGTYAQPERKPASQSNPLSKIQV